MLTEETKKGGEFLNKERLSNSLNSLPLIFSAIIYTSDDYLEAAASTMGNNQNFQNKVSSSSLRKNIFSLISPEKLEYLCDIWSKYSYECLKIHELKVAKWFNIIRDLYMQTWRNYHSFNHIYNLIKQFQTFSNSELLCIQDNPYYKIHDDITVFYAIFFHDVVYTPARNDNEEVIRLL